MTEQEMLLESWERLQKYEGELALRFYAILFRAHPELRDMFSRDMSTQRDKFEKMVLTIVHGFTSESVVETAEIESELEELGEMHSVLYGITPTQYGMTGGALLATLKYYEGSEWTPELEQVWADAYGWSVEHMLQEA
jgi:hemoglobin-like flavoprotein